MPSLKDTIPSLYVVTADGYIKLTGEWKDG